MNNKILRAADIRRLNSHLMLTQKHIHVHFANKLIFKAKNISTIIIYLYEINSNKISA